MPSEDPPPTLPAQAASDLSLLRRFRGGCQDAATQLYLRYARRIRRLVEKRCPATLDRSVEADDLVQSVFRRFFRHLKRGDYDAPPGDELWGLLLVIALNRVRSAKAHAHAARRDVRLTAGAEEAEHALREVPGEDETAYRMLRLTLEDSLREMPEHHRAVLELRIQGHDVAEIARATGRSRRSVERHLQELRRWLRHRLDQGDEDGQELR